MTYSTLLSLFVFFMTFILPLQATSLFPEKLYEKLTTLKIPLTRQLLIVNISSQRLSLYEYGQRVKEYPISTAKKGIGNHSGSFQTPLGLHRISEKIGSNSAPNAIFESRVPTGRTWHAGGSETSDFVLSRILRLKGEESGFNKGRNAQGIVVDSHERCIYIHGTNHEKSLGCPVSHGCIRMGNGDIIDLFSRVQKDALVWVTER